MIASSTSGTEVVVWVILLAISLGGGILGYLHVLEIKQWLSERRQERARKFGYRHRASNMDYQDLDFNTSEERQAYREGWDERTQIEQELEADELGMIVPKRRKKNGRST